MDIHPVRGGLRRAIESCCRSTRRRTPLRSSQQRSYATPTDVEPQGDIRAASPIQFTSDADQFFQPRAEIVKGGDGRSFRARDDGGGSSARLLDRIRIIPASPSYFTATPRYTDDLLHLSSLLRKYQLLPQLPGGQAPRVAWKTLDQYRTELGEPVRSKGYNALVQVLKRLNYIHPSLLPMEVQRALARYKRIVQPHLNMPKPIEIDRMGRAMAVGRRKSSSAKVYVVEGEGECLVNGRSLVEYFGRLHDRESAIWALKATDRIDKYNVWALTTGGGTTGQAEAIMLGLAKALLAHEPDLKPALRRAGCITRDPRRVERKKPGKLKARKMPAWVKR